MIIIEVSWRCTFLSFWECRYNHAEVDRILHIQQDSHFSEDCLKFPRVYVLQDDHICVNVYIYIHWLYVDNGASWGYD